MSKENHRKNSGHDQKEMQKKYIQFQLLKQYAAAMLEEKMKVEMKVAELAVTLNAAENVSKTENKEEFWASLGSDVYMKSHIADMDNLLVAVGANVYIQKNIEEAKKIIEKRKAEYEDANIKMEMELEELGRQIQVLEAGLQKMAEEE